jgi:uncharacterized protein with NRDE domain
MNTENTFTFLVDFITTKLVESLMADKNIGIEEAMSLFHNSETFEKLTNPDTGLYIESPAFVYSILKDEFKYGTIQGLTE